MRCHPVHGQVVAANEAEGPARRGGWALLSRSPAIQRQAHRRFDFVRLVSGRQNFQQEGLCPMNQRRPAHGRVLRLRRLMGDPRPAPGPADDQTLTGEFLVGPLHGPRGAVPPAAHLAHGGQRVSRLEVSLQDLPPDGLRDLVIEKVPPVHAVRLLGCHPPRVSRPKPSIAPALSGPNYLNPCRERKDRWRHGAGGTAQEHGILDERPSR